MDNAKTYFVYIADHARKTGQFVLADNAEQAKANYTRCKVVDRSTLRAIPSKSVKKN